MQNEDTTSKHSDIVTLILCFIIIAVGVFYFVRRNNALMTQTTLEDSGQIFSTTTDAVTPTQTANTSESQTSDASTTVPLEPQTVLEE